MNAGQIADKKDTGRDAAKSGDEPGDRQVFGAAVDRESMDGGINL